MLEANLQDLEDNNERSLKALIYGPSGTGKTVQSVALAQAITRPEEQIIYCDSGNGWVSLENHPTLKRRVKRIQIGKITTLEGIGDVTSRKVGAFANVGAIIVDEYSTIVDNDLSFIVRERASKDETKDPDTPTQPDYNTSKNRGVKYANKLFLLDRVHVILVAHERQDKDSRNILKISPLFNPKLGARLREAVHLVAYMDMTNRRVEGDSTRREQVRTIQVHPSETVVAKTRIGGLEPVVNYKQLETGVKKWLEGNAETLNNNKVVMTEREREAVANQSLDTEGMTLENDEKE
jgi:hypothetical protein